MKTLLLTLLFLLFFLGNTYSQVPDSLKKDSLKNISLIHGIGAGLGHNPYLYTVKPGPSIGYFVDINLRGRTWLFIGFNFEYYRVRYRGTSTSFFGQPYTYKTNHSNLDLSIPVKFAFRTGKEGKAFNFYPTVGMGIYLPLLYRSSYFRDDVLSLRVAGYNDLNSPLYPLLNIGFECRWQLKGRYNIGFGLNSSFLFYNTFHLKFGWNKYKK